MSTELQILAALALYIIVMGFFNLFFVRRDVNHVSKYGIIIFYFILSSISAAFLFYDLIFLEIYKADPFSLSSLALFFVLLSLIPVLLKKRANLSRMVKQHKNVFLLQMSYPYLASKSFEILFQQIVILSLVTALSKIFEGLIWTATVYGLLFALLHSPLIILIKPKFGMLFTLGALFSALFFPAIILGLEAGFIYSYIAHWSFCLILFLLFYKLERVRNLFLDYSDDKN